MTTVTLTDVQMRGLRISTLALQLHFGKYFGKLLPRKRLFWRDSTVVWTHAKIISGADHGVDGPVGIWVEVRGQVTTTHDSSFKLRTLVNFTDASRDTHTVEVVIFALTDSDYRLNRRASYLCGKDLPILKRAAFKRDEEELGIPA